MVYCGSLENFCGRKLTGGSNPSLSAILRSASFGWHGHPFGEPRSPHARKTLCSEGCPAKPRRSRPAFRNPGLGTSFALRASVVRPSPCSRTGHSVIESRVRSVARRRSFDGANVTGEFFPCERERPNAGSSAPASGTTTTRLSIAAKRAAAAFRKTGNLPARSRSGTGRATRSLLRSLRRLLLLGAFLRRFLGLLARVLGLGHGIDDWFRTDQRRPGRKSSGLAVW